MKTTFLAIMLAITLTGASISKVNAVNNRFVCNGDSLKIGLDSLPANFHWGTQTLTVKWNGIVFANDQFKRFVKPTSHTVYILEITKGIHTYKDTFNVIVRPKPVLPLFANDTSIVFGSKLRLDLNSDKLVGLHYKWNHQNNDSILSFFPASDTTCNFTVSNQHGCQVSRNYIIKVKNPIFVVVKDTLKFCNTQKVNGIIRMGHSGLDTLFKRYRVVNMQKVNSKVRSAGILSRVFKIVCNGNEDSLLLELANYDSLFNQRFVSKPGVFKHAAASHAPGYHPNEWANFAWPHALAAMRMPEAWDISKGNPAIRVAVVEDGHPNIYHEDLAGKVTFTSTPGIGMGYTPKNHTTNVAGCIAAIGDNNKGVVGAGYNIGVTGYYLPLGSGGLEWTQLEEVLNAIYLDGIKIVNFSFAGYSHNGLVQAVIDTYYDLGLIFIAGAGNANMGPRYDELYPASYNHVISVSGAATDANPSNPPVFVPDVSPDPPFSSTNLDAYSLNFNYLVHGPTGHQYNNMVDICAPSVKVKTTGAGPMDGITNDSYIENWGTSFAAPLVASVCALMSSVNPCLSNEDMEYIIKSTARPIADNTSANPWYNKLGAGFIDAKAALDMALTYGTTDLVVVQNQSITFSDVTKKYANVTVENGGTLMLDNCKLYMGPGGKILVKKGGRLVTLNSLISMSYKPGICNSASDWVGIVIEGDPTKEQGNFAFQGVANLVNTTIEYARTAVMLGDGTMGSGGGLLYATKCKFNFRNFGIFFNPYTSPTGLNNACIIKKCKFIIPLYFPTIPNILVNMQQVGIGLSGIKGLKISGCEFITDGDNYVFVIPHATYDRKAIGVSSYNSSVIVQDDKATTFPYNPQTKGSFTNLDIGVYHVGFSADQNINVNNNNFNICGVGIKLNGGTNSKIYRNDFSLTLFNTASCTDMSKETGISSYNSSGAIITENKFFNTYYLTPYDLINCNNRANKYLVGSVLNNTSNPVKLATVFSRNNFTFGMASSQFEVDNGNTLVRCNDYAHHLDAIAVYGINPGFGNCQSDRVDRLNTFTNTYAWGDVCNFNLTGNSYDYLVSIAANPKPPTSVGYYNPATSVNIKTSCLPYGTINGFPCSTQKDINPETDPRNGDVPYGNGGGMFDLFEELKIKKQLISDGAANSLEESVITGNSSNAGAVYTSLMTNSPYLSDAILNAVLSYGSYFSSTQIASILTSNSALSSNIYAAALINSRLLEDATAMESVVNAQSNTNQRQVLESEIVGLTNRYYEARTTVIDSILYMHIEDTLNNANNYYVNQIISLLENQEDEDNKYLLLPLYCSTKNTSKIATESAKFSNSIVEEKAFKDVVLFNYDVMQGLAGNTYLAANHNRILEIADDTTLYASPGANGLLEMVYGETRTRYPFTSSNVSLGKRALTVNQANSDNKSMFSLFPNPSNGQVTISFKGAINKPGSMIKIVDIAGKQVFETGIELNQIEKTIDLNNFKNGIYFVKIILADGRTFSEKLVYVK
ncbi:MAG: S8/S53 family peptidase [Bacteroidota bacterium]|nr:S8/S53 family peptidase [Bacteroidota bacterium]